MPNDNLSRVTLEFLDIWSAKIDEWSQKIPFDNPAGHKDWLFREYHAGRVKLVALQLDRKKVGFLAYQIFSFERREFYTIATYVEDKTIDWFDAVEKITTKLALEFKCVSKSLSTIRPGMVKRLTERGYRISEVTLRKTLT